MAEHREKHTIFGPFPDYDPLDSARLFLRTNRYTIVADESGPLPSELLFEPLYPGEQSEPVQAEPEADDADEPEADDADEPEADDADEPEEADDADEPVADEEATADTSPERPDEVCIRLVAERGDKWAGFTSSNMADLETSVTVLLSGNTVNVDYHVVTTGQFLNDEERGYWKAEAKALEAFLKGSGDLTNVVSDESARARSARRDLLSQGMWIAAIVFVIVFIVGVILFR